MAKENPILDLSLPRDGIESNAFRIVDTLQGAGFETYLVGGCVRDLLLGRNPKDFDIATMATPQEISRIFRNSRIIGRRFRLAHIHFGADIYEVATFRGQGAEAISAPREKGDAFIERTNTFGTPEQDASSRDFTMNGLFYDPIRECVIDHVNGYKDLMANLVRTIGNADARMQEDPVRILRAIKFSSRMGFDIEETLDEAMHANASLIMDCPTPRVCEEIFRLGESRDAQSAFGLMEHYGVLSEILPFLGRYLGEASESDRERFYRSLLWMDRMGLSHGVLPRDFILSVLYLWPALDHVSSLEGVDWGKATEAWFHEYGVRLQIPVRIRMRFYLLMSMLQRILSPRSARRFRRVRPLLRQGAFPQVLALLRLIYLTTGEHQERYEWWREQAEAEGISSAPMCLPRPKSEDSTRTSEGKQRTRRRPPRRRK